MQNPPPATSTSTNATTPCRQATASHSIDARPEGFGAARQAVTHCDAHGQRRVTEIRLSDGWRSARCPECEADEKAACQFPLKAGFWNRELSIP